MKKSIFILLCLTVAICIFASTEYKIQESEDIQKTLKFQDLSKAKEVIVDNIFGYIHVEGTSANDVHLQVRKTIKARTSDRLKKAKEEVTLDITEDGNTIDLYVNGPFRLTEEERRKRGWRDSGSGDVKIHFQPDLSADFWLKTFTGDAFSDFPVSYLPSKPGKEYREKGKFVYKFSDMTGLRIGKGGPEIKMDTMTGDLLIEKFK